MVAATASRRGSGDRRAALTTLRALFAALTRSARAIESHTGITNAQLFLLRQLTTTAPLSINELARRVQTRQNTVSAVVGRLVSAGLVEKVRSPDDGRRAALSLTGKGRRLLARAPASPTEVLVAGLDSLAWRDARALAEGLRALVEVLDLEVANAPLLFEAIQRRK